MEPESEYQESTIVNFEWTLRGLKNLFDSTKGEAKSKVTKSAKFGGGRWVILFYPNAGLPKDSNSANVNASDGYISIYLSCEPTAEEKELALSDSGRWVREGIFKFTFELRNLERNVLYSTKEATNHSFSSRTANWGWAQFARRDNVYYQSPNVKAQDAFVIVCKVVSSQRPPAAPQPYPYLPAPTPLLSTFGSLLDDPLYSDVQFVFPARRHGSKSARRIWASKKILSRADYFATMFSSNFAEGTAEGLTTAETPKAATQHLSPSASSFHSATLSEEFEDSDDEDDEALSPAVSVDVIDLTNVDGIATYSNLFGGSGLADSDYDHVMGMSTPLNFSRPTSPVADSPTKPDNQEASVRSDDIQKGQQPTTIVIKDVAYITYKAILYYLYTDNVVFAPLSSSFNRPKPNNTSETSLLSQLPATSEGTSNSQLPGAKRPGLPPTRAEWILDWMREFPGRPAPCSAKAAYRVADKLDLPELKDRAAQHIFKSLTVENIAYEVFSPFAATFEDIRKVEITFFLNHWHDIRASESMRTVWQQIRNGRHPGFEEVWPLIAQSLEFKPAPPQSPPTQPSMRMFDIPHLL